VIYSKIIVDTFDSGVFPSSCPGIVEDAGPGVKS
jgi:hypothetical protein